MDETRKAIVRRSKDTRFTERYFVGDGIDIGAGPDGLSKYKQYYPKMKSCYDWDLEDGDAMLMESVPNDKFDFVNSSHCLEHLVSPYTSLENWIRITKPGGHLIILIPDEDLYEQGIWPSTFNPDHKVTFTVSKDLSWSPVSRKVCNLLTDYDDIIQILKVELLDETFNYDIPRTDQTLGHGECAIEIILRKWTKEEIERKGRLPKKEMITFRTL